jgi:hypothetical protein
MNRFMELARAKHFVADPAYFNPKNITPNVPAYRSFLPCENEELKMDVRLSEISHTSDFTFIRAGGK